MKLNVANQAPRTHEGAIAAHISPEQELRRSVMACMLWEDNAYESGISVADRIKLLVPQCRPEFVAACAYSARTQMKLRHVPLLLVREMARLPQHKGLVSKLLPDVIQRADELTEFLAIYWATNNGKRTLSSQIKIGLANAFTKFDEYQFGKYNRDGKVKLRDSLFLSHARPLDGKDAKKINRKYKNGSIKELYRHQDSVFTKIVNNTLTTPDTWEVALSGGADKKETFERLMAEKKLFALAFLRNLRNMVECGIDSSVLKAYASELKLERILPFRFISAAAAVPQLEPMLEEMMFKCLEGQPKLMGKTVLVIDNSGSMYQAKISHKSELDRSDAACALAILLREICEDVSIISFSDYAQIVPPRKGFALRDSIKRATPNQSTNTQNALTLANTQGYDRIIVITDEQSHQTISDPISEKAYFVNIATNKNGIGYGKWLHIDGWSEAIIDYIREYENL